MEKDSCSADQCPEIKRPRLDNNEEPPLPQLPSVVHLLMGSETISVLKTVLEENSGYFRLRLSYLSEGDNMIEMPIVDRTLLREVILYMYGEEISIHTTVVDSLYELASFLEIDGLCRTIIERLGNNLHFTYAAAQKIAVRYGIPSLCRMCREFVIRNFEALATNKSFHLMDFDTLLTSLQTVRDQVHNWRIVYDAIVGWTRMDLGNRLDHFELLLSHISLHKLPLQFLEDHMLHEPLVRASERCIELVNSAIDTAHERSEGYAVISGNSTMINAFHPITGRHYRMKNPEPEKFSATCTIVSLHDYIYVLEYDGFVHRFRVSGATVVWEQMPSMNHCHIHPDFKIPVLAVRGRLYVVGGGFNRSHTLGEMMAPANSTWTLVPEMSISAWHCCFAEADDEIYAMGGWNGYVVLSSVTKFNIQSRQWLSVPPMNVQRYSATAVSRRRCIYVIGGFEGDLCRKSDVHTMECFDLRTNQWSIATTFTSESGPWFSPQACVVDEKIFVAGMKTNIANVDPEAPWISQHALWLLDENVWTAFPSLRTAETDRFAFIALRPRQDFDVTIIVDSNKIPANRQFLAEKSPYFKAMFSHDTQESRTGIVNIKGLRNTSTKRCIDHMHGVQLDMNVCVVDAEGMIRAATTFLLDDLLQSISVHILENLNTGNFEHIKRIAYLYDCHTLDDACDRFAVKNFESISSGLMFMRMEKEYVKFLIESQVRIFAYLWDIDTWSTPVLRPIECIPCDISHFKMNREPMCFKAIVRWTEHDLPNRLEHLAELFSCLDLIKTSVEYVQSEMQNNELVKRSPDCQRMIKTSLAKRQELHEVLLTWHYRDSLVAYDCERKKWRKLTVYHNAVMQHLWPSDVAVIDDGLYVLTPMECVNRLWLNMRQAAWETISSYIQDADIGELVGMVSCGRDLYVFGSEAIMRYNVDRDHWTNLEHALRKTDYTVIPAKDHIYVVGGSGWSDQSEFEAARYTILMDTWTDIAQLSMPRVNAAGVHFKGRIYVLGGIHARLPTGNVEVYHPNEDIWSSFRRMQFGRASFKAVVVNETIFVVGGDENSPQTMEYLGADGEWKIIVTSDRRLNYQSVAVANIKYEILVSGSEPASPDNAGQGSLVSP